MLFCTKENKIWLKCILIIIDFTQNSNSLKVVGLYLFFSNSVTEKELKSQLINYIFKYTWLCCPSVTFNGNWHAPNLTVPDSSICPISDKTLLLCFYSLYIIRGLNTAQYEKKNYNSYNSKVMHSRSLLQNIPVHEH